MRYPRRVLGAPMALALALALQAGAFPVAAADQVFELQLSGGKLPAAQRMLRVSQGDQVTLRIRSDEAGQLHLHAYHVEAKLTAQQMSEVSFSAYATGRFRLQWHAAAEPTSGKTGHHAEPLATLDVMPK